MCLCGWLLALTPWKTLLLYLLVSSSPPLHRLHIIVEGSIARAIAFVESSIFSAPLQYVWERERCTEWTYFIRLQYFIYGYTYVHMCSSKRCAATDMIAIPFQSMPYGWCALRFSKYYFHFDAISHTRTHKHTHQHTHIPQTNIVQFALSRTLIRPTKQPNAGIKTKTNAMLASSAHFGFHIFFIHRSELNWIWLCNCMCKCCCAGCYCCRCCCFRCFAAQYIRTTNAKSALYTGPVARS